MQNTIIYIDIASITPNPMNPRKTFDNVALGELADSIKRSGVLQPITVRTAESDAIGVSYQLVCGERRWRAAAIAGLTKIPAIIRELSDDEAMDVAITENLQRKDVEPLEEAAAFNYLLNKGQAVQDMMARFGKSESFIRTRLKLNDMIDEFRHQLTEGVISLAQAAELCKYSSELQERIYKEHMSESVNSWESWLSKRPKELVGVINSYYTNELSQYKFDKTECEVCPHNSNVYSLLPSDKPRCANMDCLKRKETEDEVVVALKLQKLHPEADFYTVNKSDRRAIELEKQGHEIAVCKDFPERVGAVISASLKARIESGEIKLVVAVCDRPYLGYIITDNPTNLIKERKERVEKYAELKTKKQLIDAEQVLTYDKVPHDVDSTDLEKQMMFYIMLENYDRVILEGGYCDNKKRWERCAVLSGTEKAYIIRRWIFAHMQKNEPFDKDLFLDFAGQFFPDEISGIKIKYQEEYLRRKERIEARIAEIEMSKDEE